MPGQRGWPLRQGCGPRLEGTSGDGQQDEVCLWHLPSQWAGEGGSLEGRGSAGMVTAGQLGAGAALPPRSPGHRGSLGPKRSPLGEAHGGCQPRPEGAARDHERMPGLGRPLEVLLDFTFPSSPAVVWAGPGEGGCPAARESPGARVLGTADSETEAAAPCCFGGPLGRMELESE